MDSKSSTSNDSPERFTSTTFVSPALLNWLGHSLELLVLQHSDRIAELLGFSGMRYSAGPYFRHHKGGSRKGGQIDLVFDRADRIYTVCEVKYLQSPVSLSVGRELAQKIEQVEQFAHKTVQRVVISNGSSRNRVGAK